MDNEIKGYAVGKGYSYIRTQTSLLSDGPHTHEEGVVYTPQGIVSVYSQGDSKYRHSTHLSIIHNRRMYSQWFKKRYTKRGLVMKARKFAKIVTEI